MRKETTVDDWVRFIEKEVKPKMKKYTYTYRKRGLPNAPELAGEVKAENYFEARALAPKQAGEDYVILNVKKEEEDNNGV